MLLKLVCQTKCSFAIFSAKALFPIVCNASINVLHEGCTTLDRFFNQHVIISSLHLPVPLRWYVVSISLSVGCNNFKANPS